ncbi:MAG: hypothetical protein K2X47_14375 [Bdellovibrionales bacterium]|nr:hypothetical protein [Bdellovibrionales bacterium]
MKVQRRFQKLIHLLLLLWPVLALVNCAYQYRETDSGLSPDQVQARLQTVLGASATSGESSMRLQAAQTLLTQGYTSVYYSTASAAGGKQGRIADLFPSAFELLSDGIPLSQLQELEIFFLYRNDGTNIDTALIFAARISKDETRVISYVGGASSSGNNGSIQGQEFQAVLQGPKGSVITVASFDVDPSTTDLSDIIQLEVFQGMTVDDNALIGKITTLDGRD